ncbi:MAG: histidinol dehydrogenase, partial [Acetobacteraceae bacterium]
MKRLDVREAGFEAGFAALLDMARETTAKVDAAVAGILAEVRAGGDAALLALTGRFDGWAPADATALRVTAAEIDATTAGIPAGLLAALDLAAERIERFHAAQRPADLELPDPAGLTLGMRWTALDAVGLYVPGGKAAYPSSVLMNALPARVAGVTEVYRIGGAQAVAALAFG